MWLIYHTSFIYIYHKFISHTSRGWEVQDKKHQQVWCLGRARFLIDRYLLTKTSWVEREGLSQVSHIRAFTAFMRGPHHDLTTSQRHQFQTSLHWTLGFNICIWGWGHKHSVYRRSQYHTRCKGMFLFIVA